MTGPTPSTAARSSIEASMIAVQAAEPGGQRLGAGGAEVHDVEPEQAGWRGGAAWRPRWRPRRLLIDACLVARQLGDAVEVERVDVGHVVDQAQLEEGLAICCSPRPSMSIAPREAKWRHRRPALLGAGGVEAQVLRLALGADERMAARRALGRELPLRQALGAAARAPGRRPRG